MLKQILCNKKILLVGASGLFIIGTGLLLYKKLRKPKACPLAHILERIAAVHGMDAVYALFDGDVDMDNSSYYEDYADTSYSQDSHISHLFGADLADDGAGRKGLER